MATDKTKRTAANSGGPPLSSVISFPALTMPRPPVGAGIRTCLGRELLLKKLLPGWGEGERRDQQGLETREGQTEGDLVRTPAVFFGSKGSPMLGEGFIVGKGWPSLLKVFGCLCFCGYDFRWVDESSLRC